MDVAKLWRATQTVGAICVTVGLLCAGLLVQGVWADSPLPVGWSFMTAQGDDESPASSDSVSAAAVSAAWEVGVHHSASDLDAHATAEGNGLYNRLLACGWTGRYNYGNNWAWEEDFKRYDRGGTEQNYLDTVDLQFYVGHGSPSGFSFANSSHDDSTVTPADCNRTWGNKDNEWVALTSCQVLGDANLAAWASCMYGGHLIMGFKTNASAFSNPSSTTGYKFADYLCGGYTVPQAWYKACDRAQGSGRIVRTLINELDCLNDKPSSGASCADSYDTDAWVQTHYCGSETARYVDTQALAGTMPVFRAKALSLDEAEAEFSRLGTIFELATQGAIQAARLSAEDPFLRTQVDGRDLEVDKEGGLFGYMDLNNLWTAQAAQRAYALGSAETAITAADARSIADQFLRDNNLMASGAQFYEVISDTISGGPIVTGTVASAQASILANEQPLVWQVIYSRIIDYTPPRIGNGPAAPTVQFSVVGPGAKQKVYVATDAGVAAGTLLQTHVLGIQGGWREVEQPLVGSDMQVPATVPVLDAPDVYRLYNQLADLVVLNSPPVEFDSRQILSHTVGYWEESAGVSQGELIPAYELKVRYLLGGEEVAVDFDFVPASPLYMRPFARIESVSAVKVQVGEMITVTAADASMPLSQLGYEGFDFVLGTDGTYLYEWYVNSIDDTNKVGSGPTASFSVPALVEDRAGLDQLSIILRVIDADSANRTSTSAGVTIDVNPRTYLPSLGN